MNKILVTTDFSSNAKAALLFAIQLASQNNAKLTFFHSYQIMKPTQWSDAVSESYENKEHSQVCNKLKQVVTSVYESTGIIPEQINCVAEKGASPDQHIMDYARENNFDYICISRKGGGKSTRLFGSNSSNLINKSHVPVIAVPEDYTAAEISMISYASDLNSVEDELEKVTGFTDSLDAKVELLHFRTPMDELTNAWELSDITKKLTEHQIYIHIEDLDHEQSLIENLEKVIQNSHPSMMIMFTQQKRSFFERIFLSSISAEYSSVSKMPVLVFKKD